MRMLILSVLLVNANWICGQNPAEKSIKTISGIVISSDENIPIPFAHVYLKNTTTGTVSNSVGEFSLKITTENKILEIQISSIGFKSTAIRIPENLKQPIEIKLDPTAITLKEVVVSSSAFDSAKYILDTSIKLTKFNYPHKTHILEGFFREVSLIDTLYNRLIEAAIRVQEIGYQKNTYDDANWEFTRNKVEVIELRKSDDFRDKNKFSAGNNKMFGDRNELYRTFDFNFAKAIGNNSNHFFSKKHIYSFDVDYTGRTVYENQSVYIIELKDHKSKSFQWTEATFYINKADFAILKIEYAAFVNPNDKKINSENLIDGKYWFQAEVSYRKINNTYYPFYISSKHSASDASFIVEKDGQIQKQYVFAQFLLTNIYDDEFSKIKWKDTEDRNIDLFKIEKPYNEDFWNNYNVIKLNPLKRNPDELEKEKSLEAQFKQGTKN